MKNMQFIWKNYGYTKRSEFFPKQELEVLIANAKSYHCQWEKCKP